MEAADKRMRDAGHARRLADEFLESIRSRIAGDLMSRTFLFLEMQRVLDARSLAPSSSEGELGRVHHYYMLKWGMNLATAELLGALPVVGIPLVASTPDLKRTAEGLLWEFGLISLLRQCAEKIRAGQIDLTAGVAEGDLVFAGNESIHLELLDHLEERTWRAFEEEWTTSDSAPHGWTLVRSDVQVETIQDVGAFWRKPSKQRVPRDSREEITRIMGKLVRPWPTPHGVFIGYDADPRVDDFYSTIASVVLEDVLTDGGIHPLTQFEGFTGLDLVKVLITLVGIYRKHVDFCGIAKTDHPEIAVVDCLTLWGPRQDLLQAIADEMDLEPDVVDRVLRCLSVSAKDAERLSAESTPVLPMLIDLGNGMVFRPISSLDANPFGTFKIIAQWRHSGVVNQISKRREEWLRNDLFSIFGGRRYVCIERGVVIKEGKRVLTDIDAAIFDRTTGELALFQLKWQDYDTQNVKQRASRAKNFAVDVDAWAEAVGRWLGEQGPAGVAQAMRLNIKNGELPIAVFLFVLSRDVARTQAYGHPIKSPWLSAATWPQFRRVRGEVGPATRVFSKLHELLREEERKVFAGYRSSDYRVVLKDGKVLSFTGLWYRSEGEVAAKTEAEAEAGTEAGTEAGAEAAPPDLAR